jgi:hypothetical protein
MHTALRATSITLADHLQRSLSTDAQLGALFDPAHAGHMVVSLSRPEEMQDRPAQGLSVWLYRVVRDSERANDPPVRIDRERLMPPPLPLRLHYLLTPVTGKGVDSAPENEQLILGKVMQCLHTHPVLRGADLRDDFEGSHIALHVRLEPLELDQITRVWDALDASYQLSVSYEVSVVNIDVESAPVRVAPVEVVLPAYGLAALDAEDAT